MLKARSNITTLLPAADLCCVGLGYLFALHVEFHLTFKGLFVFAQNRSWEAEYSTLFLLSILSWATAASYSLTYHSRPTETLAFAIRTLMRTSILWVLMTISGAFVFKLENVSRQFTIYFFVVSSILVLSTHLVSLLVLRRRRRFGYNWRTAVILGDEDNCQRFAQLLTAAYPTGFRVRVRPLSNSLKDTSNNAFTVIAYADDVFIVGGHLTDLREPNSSDNVSRFLRRGKAVHLVPGLLDAGLFHQSVGDVAGIPLISLTKGELNAIQTLAKRVGDIVASILILLLLSPLFVAIGFIIQLTSRGPVLFRQTRLGVHGKRFSLLKFRTMVVDAEQILKSSPALYAEYLANNYKLPKCSDPRITRVGSFLRTTRLDELPQLLNVLTGDMSLVGPRPIVPAEVEKYGDAAELFLSVKPGMTGRWQISGRSDVQTYEKRIQLDLEYIRDQSLHKDFEILLRTIPTVLRGKGAH